MDEFICFDGNLDRRSNRNVRRIREYVEDLLFIMTIPRAFISREQQREVLRKCHAHHAKFLFSRRSGEHLR